jgi:hypothetical protein
VRAASSPAEREQRANRGGGVIWIRKAEALPDKITNDKIHYCNLLPLLVASSISSAIKTAFVLLS